MPADRPMLLAELDACLDGISASLSSGDFRGLAALAGRLDDLACLLARGPHALSSADLRALRNRAARQMHLLGAARDGVNAAFLRVGQLRRVPGELSTYDRGGHGRTIHFAPESMEHRA